MKKIDTYTARLTGNPFLFFEMKTTVVEVPEG